MGSEVDRTNTNPALHVSNNSLQRIHFFRLCLNPPTDYDRLETIPSRESSWPSQHLNDCNLGQFSARNRTTTFARSRNFAGSHAVFCCNVSSKNKNSSFDPYRPFHLPTTKTFDTRKMMENRWPGTKLSNEIAKKAPPQHHEQINQDWLWSGWKLPWSNHHCDF